MGLNEIKENLRSKLGDIGEEKWLDIDAAIDQAFNVTYDVAERLSKENYLLRAKLGKYLIHLAELLLKNEDKEVKNNNLCK